MQTAADIAINWVEQGYVPDHVIRRGIRRLLRQRLGTLPIGDVEAMSETERKFVAMMDDAEVAPWPHKANDQHYELPPAFFEQVLGAHRKYSCGYWSEDVDTLDVAESAALQLSCERAGIQDGMDILDLGCGWGSLSLWIAQNYPNCRITAVSNSYAQGRYLRTEAGRRALDNVRVLTADMNHFSTDGQFDRVVSVEMFEHMRNYRRLLARTHDWLRPGGRFFMHIFCHRAVPYEFTDDGPGDWMGRYFFTGGMMPSDALPLRFQDRLHLVDRWRWSGRHYEKTANAWLANMDARRESLWPVFAQTYAADSPATWWMRWRIFFMACAELFAFNAGQEWWVSHYLFERPRYRDGQPAPKTAEIRRLRNEGSEP